MSKIKHSILKKVKVLFCHLLVAFLMMNTAQAQEYNFSIYGGGLYYLGDLSPRNSVFSFSSYNPGLGLSLGRKLNDVFDIKLKFVFGRISGSDEEAKDEGRRLRNLSFYSSLYELGLHTDINLNKWLNGLDKYGLELYYTTGLSVYHFNPQAYFQGSYIALQPLGTEGQQNDQDKYSLTQISVPFGLGVRFDLSSQVEMGFEVVPRWTFTDYLDDVSGPYVTYDDLLATNGLVAAQLSDRTGEYLNTGHVPKPAGALRGDPNNNDWYFFTGLSLMFKWGSHIQEVELEQAPDIGHIK